MAKITQLDAVVDHIKDIYEAEPCTEVKKPWLPPLAAEIINPNITNIEVGELPDTSFDVGILTCLISRSRKYILTISLGQEIWRYSAHPRLESLQQQLMRFYRSQAKKFSKYT